MTFPGEAEHGIVTFNMSCPPNPERPVFSRNHHTKVVLRSPEHYPFIKRRISRTNRFI